MKTFNDEKNIEKYLELTHAMLTVEEGKLLFSLAKNSSKDGVIVEIGAYKGGSTIFLAKGSKLFNKSKIYSIDPHNFGLYVKNISLEEIPANTLPFFKNNLIEAEVEDWVIPIVKTSKNASKKWNKPISLLWIDGNHEYPYVKSDFLLWEKHLITGGIIAFHDTKDSIHNMKSCYMRYIKANDGPVRTVRENILYSPRFINIQTVDSITYAEKIKDANLLENISSIYKINFSLKLISFRQNFYRSTDSFLGKIGLFLKSRSPALYKIIKKIKGDKKFLFSAIKPFTMVSKKRLNQLYNAATDVEKNNIDGSFVECGVWKGGCAAIMAFVSNKKNSDRKIWLFDSFEGLPKPTMEDGLKADKYMKNNFEINPRCIAPIEDVIKIFFEILKLKKENVFIKKGWFQDTLPEAKKGIGDIAILRLDGDWYQSTKCCLDNLYDNVVPGGYVIIDDYGYWEGCKKAVDEFIKKRQIKTKLHKIDDCGVYFKK